jgi:predicted metal-dependent peptidase
MSGSCDFDGIEPMFYGLLAARLELQEDSTIETMQTDGKTLKFSPGYVDSLNHSELITLLCHELCHLSLGHHLRRDGRDPKLWDEACDYVVNDILHEAGFVLPGNAYYDAKWQGMSVEEIYWHRQQGKEPPQAQQNKPSAGNGQQGPQQPSQGNKKPGQGQGKGQPGKSPEKAPTAPQAGESAFGGEIMDQTDEQGDPLEGQEAEQALDDHLEDMAMTLQQATKSQGSAPAGVGRAIKELLHPQQDWRTILRDFLTQMDKSDYTWMRPNKRLLAQGLYLPSLKAEGKLGTLVVGIDTSGSLSVSELSRFRDELMGIVDEMEFEKIIAIACDSKVQKVVEILPGDTATFPTKGGGGTSFRPVFRYVEEENIEPDCLIYFTDMMGDFPFHEPHYPVLWMDTLGAVAAPWGRHVKMRADQ